MISVKLSKVLRYVSTFAQVLPSVLAFAQALVDQFKNLPPEPVQPPPPPQRRARRPVSPGLEEEAGQ